MIRGEQLVLPEIEDTSPIEAEPGVSVTLEERYLALVALADMYGEYNQAKGFGKAINMPNKRQNLELQYGNVDTMAAAMKTKNAGLLESEIELGEPLTRQDDLRRAGFDDVETDALLTRLEVRRAIGTGVGTRARQSFLRRIEANKKKIVSGK
ncbi:MAG TPA: hypothetical protein VLG09_03050 [Candidatus Saccharimonadales bacterium]|jgi:hypothetical protein|nr:hypothetical protein [Candidatus Saccharimonadales bacterium]